MHMLRHKRLVWNLILVILEHVVGSTPVKTKIKKMQSDICFLGANIKKRRKKLQCTNLLLRKQFWMTLMMKEAASFSLKPGLNRCLDVGGEKKLLVTTGN